MATGLIALLDDVVAIAKVAAASLDDTAGAAARVGAKAAGVVVDDAAVTPRYVTGFSAAREVPIVAKIARGSLKNKLLYLLPAGLLLSTFAPWSITPLLMAGGTYLCFEGAEKIYEIVVPHAHEAAPEAAAAAARPASGQPDDLENTMVAGAIRTDLILSGEIMAIALAQVADQNLVAKILILAIVGVGITVGVYGVVALIVKADDAGLYLARSRFGALRLIGRGLVAGMPAFLKALAAAGTAAMLWVGGGILLHALEGYGVAAPAHRVHDLAEAAGGFGGFGGAILAWLAGALGAGLAGLVVGAAIVAIVLAISALREETRS